MIRHRVYYLLLGILLMPCFWYLLSSQKEIKKTYRSTFVMGTIFEIEVFGKERESAVNQIFEKLNEIEELMSLEKENSEINQINRVAGVEGVKISNDSVYVIKQALKYSKITEGSFDITTGVLTKLWRTATNGQTLPKKQEVISTMKLVNYKLINLNSQKSIIMLKKSGMKIDLGGIAKGYALDEAVKIIRKLGINNALLNLGGQVAVIGNKPNGEPWQVGIQDPNTPRGNYIAKIQVVNKSVATSGNYERFFLINGKRFGHILDSKTGYPVANGCLSVTIVADRSIDADALSTGVFVLGPQKGMALIEKLPRIEGIIITNNHKILVSSALRGKVEFLSKEYHVYENR